MNKAIFLDRDGVINTDHGFVSCQQDFRFIDGVFDALRQWSASGYLLVVITNQSGIGRGYYSQHDFDELSAWMLAELKQQDIQITQVYHCSHAPEADCDCRKPAPSMIRQACDEHNIDPTDSWMVGDKLSDMQAARGAGVGNLVLVLSGQFQDETHEATDVIVMEDLLATCKLIPARLHLQGLTQSPAVRNVNI